MKEGSNEGRTRKEVRKERGGGGGKKNPLNCLILYSDFTPRQKRPETYASVYLENRKEGRPGREREREIIKERKRREERKGMER